MSVSLNKRHLTIIVLDVIPDNQESYIRIYQWIRKALNFPKGSYDGGTLITRDQFFAVIEHASYDGLKFPGDFIVLNTVLERVQSEHFDKIFFKGP